ncbi:MAG: hypothetical protein ACI8RY_002018 [Urechidicola sp.]|jgi:hypothetical protein
MTKELRSILKGVLYDELEQIEERLDQLEPRQRVELIVKLMPYIFPKLESISHVTNEPLDWEIKNNAKNCLLF